MPLRASKMKGFILGFHRFVWCPKWTPDSNNSFTPILNTIFPLVEAREFPPEHPAEHGISYFVVLAAPNSPEFGIDGRFPSPVFQGKAQKTTSELNCDNCYFRE